MAIILGIESSCDETSASICVDGKICSNVIATQKVHEQYGGVIPEIASRMHQANIIPVVTAALFNAKIDKNNIDAIAFTRGPGLLGALLVGTSFSKAMALALNIPIIEVNHMQAHILAHFIQTDGVENPTFPFLCLTVSGGHTQIVMVSDYFDMQILGQTTDDAAGEAFDKTAKLLGLSYPGGPLIDKYAKNGNPNAYSFTEPQIAGLNFSFSGLKTQIMYFLKQNTAVDKNFIAANLSDICASVQQRINSILISKLEKAVALTGVNQIAIAGGVSANSGLRNALIEKQNENKWKVFIPPFEYCTDNAAMIAITGFHKFLKGDFASQDLTPMPRYEF